MKSLITIVLIIILTPMTQSFAQSSSNFVPSNYFSIGIGTYQPNDDFMEELYGTMTRFRGTYSKELSPKFRIEGGLAYISKSGKPLLYNDGFDQLDGSLKMTIIQFEGLGKYFLTKGNNRFYVGGGITYMSLKEDITIETLYNGNYVTESESFSFNTTGIVLLLGVDVALGEAKNTFVYFEASTRSANVQTDFGNDDVGGGVIEIGLRFKN